MSKTVSLFVLCVASVIGAHAQSWLSSSQGLAGGSIFGLVSRGNTLYAATFTGGIYSSTDLGVSWVNIAYAGGGVSGIAAPTGALLALQDARMTRSTDEGATWQPVTLSVVSLVRAFGTACLAACAD